MKFDPARIAHIDGKEFCVVCMQVLDAARQKVKLTPIHGVARVTTSALMVDRYGGDSMPVPDSALKSILPSDGNPTLGAAEYYVIVRIGGMAS